MVQYHDGEVVADPRLSLSQSLDEISEDQDQSPKSPESPDDFVGTYIN